MQHPGYKKSLTILVLSALLLVPASCSSKPKVSRSEEINASMATVQWLESRYGLVKNHNLNVLLKRVTDRISAGIYGTALETELESDPKQFNDNPWQVFVIRNKEPNAFAAGAGLVIITSGMLRHIGTEAELAAIISHEIAHELLGHTREALSEVKSQPHSAPQASFSLEQELAADDLAIKLMFVGRYDISYAIRTLSIGYRAVPGLVSGIPPSWFAMRQANMQGEIDSYGNFLPATATSREFTRVMKSLFGVG